jgi:hypothetical protein
LASASRAVVARLGRVVQMADQAVAAAAVAAPDTVVDERERRPCAPGRISRVGPGCSPHGAYVQRGDGAISDTCYDQLSLLRAVALIGARGKPV